MQNVHFTAPELARRLGVNESTVKRWIDKGLLGAERTSGGHRRVTEAHLRDFIAQNPTLGEKSYHIRRWHKSRGLGWQPYFNLHRTGEHRKASAYLEAQYLSSGKVEALLEHVVAPTLREIGAAWLRGELDIIDEHRMSFYIRSDILSLSSLVRAPRPSAPKILLACVPGENHELSLVLLALLAQDAGWQATVLGINVPLEQVARAAKSTDARAIALTKIYSSAQSTAAEILAVRMQIPRKTQLLIGGSGWTETERTALEADKAVLYLDSRSQFLHFLQHDAAKATKTTRSARV